MSRERDVFIDARALKIIAVTHPELVLDAQRKSTPLINDMNVISEIHEYICRQHNPSGNYMDKLLFIAMVLRLYNPDSLIIDCKLRQGLRDSISKRLGSIGSNTSYYVSQARAYMKIKSFSASVDRITDGYLNQNLVS